MAQEKNQTEEKNSKSLLKRLGSCTVQEATREYWERRLSYSALFALSMCHFSSPLPTCAFLGATALFLYPATYGGDSPLKGTAKSLIDALFFTQVCMPALAIVRLGAPLSTAQIGGLALAGSWYSFPLLSHLFKTLWQKKEQNEPINDKS
jgi:hypothetical protein